MKARPDEALAACVGQDVGSTHMRGGRQGKSEENEKAAPLPIKCTGDAQPMFGASGPAPVTKDLGHDARFHAHYALPLHRHEAQCTLFFAHTHT